MSLSILKVGFAVTLAAKAIINQDFSLAAAVAYKPTLK
jgi:hypothetical protein